MKKLLTARDLIDSFEDYGEAAVISLKAKYSDSEQSLDYYYKFLREVDATGYFHVHDPEETE